MAEDADTVLLAWRRYLRRTKKLVGARYDEVEPYAWRQLQEDLKGGTLRDAA